jgi:hypothetical protein
VVVATTIGPGETSGDLDHGGVDAIPEAWPGCWPPTAASPRRVLDGRTVKHDGTPAAPSVTSRRRKILHSALEYAVELELLDKNPMPALKSTPPKTTR